MNYFLSFFLSLFQFFNPLFIRGSFELETGVANQFALYWWLLSWWRFKEWIHERANPFPQRQNLIRSSRQATPKEKREKERQTSPSISSTRVVYYHRFIGHAKNWWNIRFQPCIYSFKCKLNKRKTFNFQIKGYKFKI